MKMMLSLFAAVALTAGVASAQDVSGNSNNSVAGTHPGVDVGGFRAPAEIGPGPVESSKFPNPHPDLKPKLGGVFVDATKYGYQLVNPGAPASYGMGEKYLAAPSSRADIERASGVAAHHDAGGIKFFSLEF
jgi:hypothetical protein